MRWRRSSPTRSHAGQLYVHALCDGGVFRRPEGVVASMHCPSVLASCDGGVCCRPVALCGTSTPMHYPCTPVSACVHFEMHSTDCFHLWRQRIESRFAAHCRSQCRHAGACACLIGASARARSLSVTGRAGRGPYLPPANPRCPIEHRSVQERCSHALHRPPR